ncbi:polysaccharide biosynthesis tyrosine autokinase [Lapillicoccus jejuensis]|uniref:polysaccharide biosynthesis tyrosine autokinase n=1 Tax=Lapillicoccus jejuensis TaxID=402171 RepID=UPI00114FBDAF|nr:polysaccharide biosynthesis tyrosine autokinase [Lapillicoccus jejuensis]
MDGVRVGPRGAAFLVVMALLGAVVAVLLCGRTTTTYSATTGVFVAVDPTTAQVHGADGAAVVRERAKAYADAATSPEVLRAVVTRLNLPESWTTLSSQVSASHPDTGLDVDVTARAASPALARSIADAVGDQLCLTARTLEPTTPAGAALVKLTVDRPATLPTSPEGLPDVPTGLVGGLLGLGAGALALLARRRLETTVRGRRDAAALTAAPVLATVPLGVEAPRPLRGPFDATGPLGAVDETGRAFDDLAHGLLGLPLPQAVRTLVVCSADAGDGKSSVAAQLAQALAATGERVLLVDADLRRPRQHEVFETALSPGLTDVLGGADLATCVTPCPGAPTLDVLPAGATSCRSTDLVGTHRMAEVLQDWTDEGYLVVVDAPPLLPVIDGAILARMAQGALLVTRARQTSREHLAGAAELLRTSGAGLLGVVVNGVAPTGRPLAAEPAGARVGAAAGTAEGAGALGVGVPARLRPTVSRTVRVTTGS